MDRFYLNPFIFIAQDKEHYFINASDGQTFILSNEQADALIGKNVFSRKELEELFEITQFKKIMELKCFLPFTFDLNSRNSRTNGYFFELGWMENYQELKEKKVYLLGAGALGTHVGWNLCSLGVKNFTILDYDEIEASNLNRQVLYTYEDIGRKKTEVLKERLLAINPECNIETINMKADGTGCLKELFRGKPDLVVRGIDTPVEISHWVFSVCEEMGIPYVSGGTMGTRFLYGPTYVPGVTPAHNMVMLNGRKMYSNENYARRIKGTGISSSFAISSVASEIVIDAVKILCGKGELVKYGGKIKLIDHFEKEADIVDEKEEKVKESPGFVNFLITSSAVIVAFAALMGNNTPIIPIVYLLLATLVFGIWHTNEKQMYVNTVLVGSVVGCTNLVISMFLGRVSFSSGTDIFGRLSAIPATIFMLTLMICIHAMLFIMVTGLENKVFKKAKLSISL